MIGFFQNHALELMIAVVQHLEMSLLALGFSLLFAAVTTIFLLFHPKWKRPSIYILSLLYAIPSFALFALLIPWTGLGRTTAIVVLVVYAQYTLVRTWLEGLSQVDTSVIEAAAGMGMTKRQILFMVQLPLAQSSLFAGIRLAANAIIAIGTIAATINAGGLGTLLFDGLRTMNMFKLLWGIVLTVGISLWFNLIFYLIEDIVNE